MHIRNRMLLLVGAVVFSSAFAGTPPPKDPLGDAISWPQISKRPPATDLVMGKLEVQLEITTLGDISAAAGRGAVSHQGDAGDSVYWLCYTLPHQRVWILSNGEMGGPEHAVTEIDAEKINASASTKDCPDLPQSLEPISFHGGIWLGSDLTRVSRALGPPSYTKGQWQSFNYKGKVAGHCAPDGFDLMNWVLIKSESGRVVGIKAGQVTSC